MYVWGVVERGVAKATRIRQVDSFLPARSSRTALGGFANAVAFGELNNSTQTQLVAPLPSLYSMKITFWIKFAEVGAVPGVLLRLWFLELIPWPSGTTHPWIHRMSGTYT